MQRRPQSRNGRPLRRKGAGFAPLATSVAKAIDGSIGGVLVVSQFQGLEVVRVGGGGSPFAR